MQDRLDSAFLSDSAEYWKERCGTLEHLLQLANKRICTLSRQVKLLKAA